MVSLHRLYQKPFDSESTTTRYTNLIKNIYKNASMKVNLPSETKPIKIEGGVRQGDTIYVYKLFTLVPEEILTD